MNAHEKLERLEELLEERNRINAELIAMLEPASEEKEEVEPVPGKRKQRKCSQCGKPGHIARKCLRAAAAPAPLKDKPDQLTEEQFDEMKELQKSGDLSTRVFAAEHGLAITEVNRAIPFARYEDYAR